VRLDGIHHVTCITADAPRNVDFYTRVLGLRLVKKTVNQDDPTVYHLFYADEDGSPGSDITFFEYPGVPRGRAGAGMVHTVQWRVASEDALEFWQRRLAQEGSPAERSGPSLAFEDPEGLRHELRAVETPDEPLVARHPEIPEGTALQGFDGVLAYSADPAVSRALLETSLAFVPAGDAAWEARGPTRGGRYEYDVPPAERGLSGAGTVHHVAWSSTMDEQESWRERAAAGGARPTPVVDRFWFRSVYFREPSGVLFEIATQGPGFGVDEDLDRLGEALVLPPAFEHLREQIEPVLTPLPDPRPWAASRR
jgi:glyoxalase family protein